MKPTPLIDACDETHFGGKASRLAMSLRAGLPVPPGFALSTTQVEALAESDPGVRYHLECEFTALAAACAVRSSGIGEDSDAASFAGQHLTLLNIRSAEHLAPAVLQVRASAYSGSALAYRRKLGLADSPRIAVVVQRMIEPDCAGVMFTRNPVDGSREFVIEATWGLGEAVVAGLVVPDNYAIDPDGRVLRRRIGEKDIALRSRDDGGTLEVPVETDLVHAPCLSDAQLAELHAMASRCESHFGSGLDLEWAFSGGRLYLLQARAMTRNR